MCMRHRHQRYCRSSFCSATNGCHKENSLVLLWEYWKHLYFQVLGIRDPTIRFLNPGNFNLRGIIQRDIERLGDFCRATWWSAAEQPCTFPWARVAITDVQNMFYILKRKRGEVIRSSSFVFEQNRRTWFDSCRRKLPQSTRFGPEIGRLITTFIRMLKPRITQFIEVGIQTYLSAYADISWIMNTDGVASSTRDSLRLPRSFLALSFSRGKTWSKVLVIPYHKNSVIWIVAFCWSLNSKNHHAFACRPIHVQKLWSPCSLPGPTKFHNTLHHALWKHFRFLAAPSQWLQTLGFSRIAPIQIARTHDYLGRLEDRISNLTCTLMLWEMKKRLYNFIRIIWFAQPVTIPPSITRQLRN